VKWKLVPEPVETRRRDSTKTVRRNARSIPSLTSYANPVAVVCRRTTYWGRQPRLEPLDGASSTRLRSAAEL